MLRHIVHVTYANLSSVAVQLLHGIRYQRLNLYILYLYA